MIYARVIVDECGEVMEYISDLLEEEVEEILEEHPEWWIKCIPVEM
jgi:nucleoside-triphosphatase THEP1